MDRSGLSAGSELAVQAETIDAALDRHTASCLQPSQALHEAESLADSLDSKIILLVFGKFNAGKSSFCNFIAERFAAYGEAVQYFLLDAGRVVETSGPFKEGVTETTSRLQGVTLGENLVLLDTPGLHSVTPENAALTQRFIESADGVIWLTSSTSPGQVQELDDLGRELHRNKPLLPVLTRSDEYDEDEVDGELVRVLRNKIAPRRAQQEADVQMRGEAKLVAMDVDVTALKRPVSVSVHMARERKEAALADAGFERLYAALLSIVQPALAYKRRKRAEVALHHLEENVLGALRNDLLPMLANLKVISRRALGALDEQQEQVAHSAWRTVVSTLPALLESHSVTRDVKALYGEVSNVLGETFGREAHTRCADFVISLNPDAALIDPQHDDRFDEIAVDLSIVGVDYQRLHAALKTAIREQLLRLCSDAAGQVRASIGRLMESAERVEEWLGRQEQALLQVKGQLRM
ncbi:dynamin family protein [Paraburkholderia sp. GAS199]|uniref:dynamin family protein n=1 Tax=Paraburkholderia sp. GAS199 TaxID=3035126 RepID=UPI003D1EB94C